MSSTPEQTVRTPLLADARRFLGPLVLVGYLAAARGVENLYPLSTFPMYSTRASPWASRIMARTAAGSLREVTRFERWHCDNLPALEAASSDSTSIPYIDREREAWVRGHPGSGGAPVELVRRYYSFDGVARPTSVLALCTAVER